MKRLPSLNTYLRHSTGQAGNCFGSVILRRKKIESAIALAHDTARIGSPNRIKALIRGLYKLYKDLEDKDRTVWLMRQYGFSRIELLEAARLLAVKYKVAKSRQFEHDSDAHAAEFHREHSSFDYQDLARRSLKRVKQRRK